jgi:hypothetical protein
MKRRLSEPAATVEAAAEAAPPAADASAAQQHERKQHEQKQQQQQQQQQVPAQMKGVTIVKPEEYETQLEAKLERVRAIFSGFDLPPVEVHRSAPIHYRQRAEFRRAIGERHGGSGRVGPAPGGVTAANTQWHQ